MSSKRRNLSALVFLINSTTKVSLIRMLLSCLYLQCTYKMFEVIRDFILDACVNWTDLNSVRIARIKMTPRKLQILIYWGCAFSECCRIFLACSFAVYVLGGNYWVRQEPISKSLQLPYKAYVTAFLQTDLFFAHLFFWEKRQFRSSDAVTSIRRLLVWLSLVHVPACS